MLTAEHQEHQSPDRISRATAVVEQPLLVIAALPQVLSECVEEVGEQLDRQVQLLDREREIGMQGDLISDLAGEMIQEALPIGGQQSRIPEFVSDVVGSPSEGINPVDMVT